MTPSARFNATGLRVIDTYSYADPARVGSVRVGFLMDARPWYPVVFTASYSTPDGAPFDWDAFLAFLVDHVLPAHGAEGAALLQHVQVALASFDDPDAIW